VVAANRRLYQTGAVAITASHHLKDGMARVLLYRSARKHGSHVSTQVTRERLAHELTKFLVGHGRLDRHASIFDVDMIDNPDNCGVNRRPPLAERVAGGASFEHDQHFFGNAGANAVDSKEWRPPWCVVDLERLHQQKLCALELAMLLGRHDRANHSCDLHHSI
jgi:hypothetical protein